MKYIYKTCDDCGFDLYRASIDPEFDFVDVCEAYCGNGEWKECQFADDVMNGWCTSQDVTEEEAKEIIKELDEKWAANS